MFETHRFLHPILGSDIREGNLLRVGGVYNAWMEDGEAVFQAALVHQDARPDDPDQFDPGATVGDVYIRLRAYGTDMIRLYISRSPEPIREESVMLQISPSAAREPLHLLEKTDGWLVLSEDVERAWIRRADFSPQISPDGEIWLRFQDQDHFFPGLWDALPAYWFEQNGSQIAGFSLQIQPSEHFCGSGERFTRPDLFGRQIDLINYDALGVNNDRAYKNIPFLISSRLYGLFVHSHSKMHLDIGAHSSRSLQWLMEDDCMDLFFIGGCDMSQILYNYRCLTGFPALPPAWSFGAWMSRMTYRSADEASGIAGRLRAEGYPMDVIHLDTGWFEREWICDWRFSAERFPNPSEFFARMLHKGFHVSLWQYPYIHRESALLQEAREGGFVGASDDPNSGVGLGDTLDFTNPVTAAWYDQRLLQPLFTQGAACIETDFGEEVDERARYATLNGKQYRNLFALLYQKAAWEASCRALGNGEAVLWARSAWAGSQRYPVHWGGDPASTFDGMAGSLCGGLHLGLSGFAFWGHDVGGFHGIPDFMESRPSERLYLRWVQMAVFSSHLRFHGSSPREPWEYPGVAALVREWLRLRYALLPYILNEAEKCTQNGLPMLRSMVIDWPHDPSVWAIQDQYLFGDSFLVCPVLHDGVARTVYMPEGEWVDFWTGQVLMGPQNLPLRELPPARIPLYVRRGHTIPFAEPVQHTGQLAQARRFNITFDESYPGFNGSELSKWVRI